MLEWVLVRQRVLGLFERGVLSRETVEVMQGSGHSGGFSVHAGVRVERRIVLGVSGCCGIVRVRRRWNKNMLQAERKR